MQHIVVHHLGVHTVSAICATLWCDTVCQTSEFEIRIKPQVIVITNRNGKIHRTLPLVGRKHLHDHHLRTSETACFLEHNLLAIRREHIQLFTRYISLAIAFGTWIIGVQELEGFLHLQRCVEAVLYPNHFVLARHIILFIPRDRQTR